MGPEIQTDETMLQIGHEEAVGINSYTKKEQYQSE
jgi:hypothetical protein